MHVVVLAAVFCQHLRDRVALGRVRDADGQAGDVLLLVGQRLLHSLVQRLNAAGVFQHRFALARRLHAALAAQKQMHAQFLLELPDMVADRRLCEREPFRRFGKAARFVDRQERLQLCVRHTVSLLP